MKIEKMPKTRYKVGEEITAEGLKVVDDNGNDITGKCIMYTNGYKSFPNKKELEVLIQCEEVKQDIAITLKRKGKKAWIITLIAAIIAALIAVIVGVNVFGSSQATDGYSHEGEDTGSKIVSAEGMSDEEIQKMLDEQAEASRITVSVSPNPVYSNGKLRINFIVPETNPYSERIEVTQDDNIIYSSGIVPVGNKIEWATIASGEVHEGSATATVYAVDEDGKDYGNPVSVDVNIVYEGNSQE